MILKNRHLLFHLLLSLLFFSSGLNAQEKKVIDHTASEIAEIKINTGVAVKKITDSLSKAGVDTILQFRLYYEGAANYTPYNLEKYQSKFKKRSKDSSCIIC